MSMLSSKRDQSQFSLNNYNASLREKVIRINKMISKGNMSRLSMIFRVNVVLNRGLLSLTVTDISTACAVVIFILKVSCIMSVDGI